MKWSPHSLLRLLSSRYILGVPLLCRNSRLMILRSTESGVAVLDVLDAGSVEGIRKGAGLN